MVKCYLILLLVFLMTAACKPEKKDLLIRNWQEIATHNEHLDEVMKSQQEFIDTVGAHTSQEENLSTYGAANIDSFRQSLQANMDSFRSMQQRSVAQTRFDFRKNGMVYIHTDIGTDSVTWKLEDDGITLTLDEKKESNPTGTRLQMEITHLSDTSLKLRFLDNNSYSSASFIPVKK